MSLDMHMANDVGCRVMHGYCSDDIQIPIGSRVIGALSILILTERYLQLLIQDFNGLKLQTGRPLSCHILKSLFKNSLCFMHSIVPTLPSTV